METLLWVEGAYVDGLYYCPHHPHKRYDGEIATFKFDCNCRKPKTGMLLKAAEDFNNDLSQSWIVGDGENDITCGLMAGCKSVLINGNGTSGINGNYGQTDTLNFLLEFAQKYIR